MGLGGLVTERQWELYRRSVVEKMPDSDYKGTVLKAIAYKLTRLEDREKYSSQQRRRTDAPVPT